MAFSNGCKFEVAIFLGAASIVTYFAGMLPIPNNRFIFVLQELWVPVHCIAVKNAMLLCVFSYWHYRYIMCINPSSLQIIGTDY